MNSKREHNDELTNAEKLKFVQSISKNVHKRSEMNLYNWCYDFQETFFANYGEKLIYKEVLCFI